MKPELRTDRLTFRRCRPDDFDALLDIYGRPEVARMVASWPIPADPDLIRERCQPFPKEEGMVGMVEADGVVVGSIGCHRAGGSTGFGMGYGFHPDHWGKGYATEIGLALVDAVFARYDTETITAGHWLDNPASGRVLEKLGLAKTEVMPGYCVARGEVMDAQLYEITRAGWLARNPLLIETDRLEIRPYAARDFADFQRIAGQEQVARMLMSVPYPLDAETARDWIDSRRYAGPPKFTAGIFLKDGPLVGNLGIGGDPVSVMYFIDPVQAGQGYATEALEGFLRFTFPRFDLEEVTAAVMNDNPASARVLEKNGFEIIGHDACQSMARLEPAPNTEYRLTRTAFEARL
ncbi:MAG: GNAT family N-acetyltransferase [Paracoccaceae bacterium]|nr:GNAT family N-acetyltransferase [Paracoccaceae bacterium]